MRDGSAATAARGSEGGGGARASPRRQSGQSRPTGEAADRGAPEAIAVTVPPRPVAHRPRGSAGRKPPAEKGFGRAGRHDADFGRAG